MRVIERAANLIRRAWPLYSSPIMHRGADNDPALTWQLGARRGVSATMHPTVEACVSRTAESISMMPVLHERRDALGGKVRVKNSPIERVLRRPNAYQTGPDLMQGIIRGLLLQGESFTVRVHTATRSFDQLHPLPRGQVSYVIGDSGDGTPEIFYRVGGHNNVVDFDRDYFIPAREMLHLRKHYDDNPLRGITPIQAALPAIETGAAINQHMSSFHWNMGRPSGILSTDQVLKKEQMQQLRARFEEQAKDLDSGGIPILSGGLKFEPLALTSADAQVIQTYRMTEHSIAAVFGVPFPLVTPDAGVTYSNSEVLLRHWLSTGLGWLATLIEQHLERLFGLDDFPDESLRFDRDVLLQTDFKSRMEGLRQAVAGKIFTINDARMKEGLAPIEGGNEILIQQQDRPLSQIYDLAEVSTGDPEPVEDEPEEEPEPEEDEPDDERNIVAFWRAFEDGAAA